MPLDINGILTSLQLASETTTVIEPYMREVFINEFPLWTRLPHEMIGAAEYNIDSYNVRQRTITINQAVVANAQYNIETMTFTDTSQMQQGDILEIYATNGTSYERMMVLSDPNAAGTTVSVLRGVEGTTPVANDHVTLPSSYNGYIVGNSRTGSEVAVQSFRSVRTLTPQQVQTFQFGVQVGGLANAIQNVQVPQGISDVFSLEQKTKMTEFARDVEYTSYYGIGQSATVNSGSPGRRTQAGLRKQILNYSSGLNVKLTAGASYTKLNFIADGVQRALDGAGNPDVMLVSTNFATGLATWSVAQQNFMNPRETPYIGIPVREFETAFTGQPMTIIPSYQLRPGTAVVLTSSDVKFRYIRPAFFQKRGLRGDAWEGDFIGDYCIEVGHPGWHAWIEGITSFA